MAELFRKFGELDPVEAATVGIFVSVFIGAVILTVMGLWGAWQKRKKGDD